MKTVLQEEIVEYTCDSCGRKSTDDPCITVSFDYGSVMDTREVYFCDDLCFLQWVKDNKGKLRGE